jgi:hypothetical protein
VCPDELRAEDATSTSINLQSQLAVDIDSTRDRLSDLRHEDQGPIRALSLLSGAYDKFWPDWPEVMKVADGTRRSVRGFTLFEDAQMWAFVDGRNSSFAVPESC